MHYCIAVFLFMVVHCYGQDQDELLQWADEIADNYSGEIENANLTALIEDMLSLARNPININSAGRAELERIFFLSDLQIENILFKRYVNGPFYSIYELQAVEGLPVSTIKMLQPVVFLGEANQKEKPPFRVWGDAFFRGEYQIERAKGFKPNEDDSIPFEGDPLKLY
jgi:hypothetical protein